MSSPPAVSLITAAYNGARLLPATIESVFAQTMGDFEMIVVDDRSTDDTLAVLRGYTDPRLRVVALGENVGCVRARNHAVSLASGRHIAALDHDDICHPERLSRQLTYLDAHPDVVLVGCAAENLEGQRVRPGHLPGATSPALIRWLMLLRNPIAWSTVMIRGETARALQPFSRPERQYAEDFDLYHRAAGLGKIARIDEPLLLYRVHAGGASLVHRERMIARTADVLAEAYAPLLGDHAADAAALVSRHVAAGIPIDDLQALLALAAIIDRLEETIAPDDPLIAAETSRIWWGLVSRAIRSGALPPGEALSARPVMLQSAEHEPGAFITSRVIGAGRSVLAPAAEARQSTKHRKRR